MKFSTIFRKLEINLSFFDYYKFFVNYFVNITKSLVQLKIKNFKNVSIKNRFKKKHFNKTNFKQKIIIFLKQAKSTNYLLFEIDLFFDMLLSINVDLSINVKLSNNNLSVNDFNKVISKNILIRTQQSRL